ncbi:MAG: hypothetical protein HOP28_18485 [Gemmatimonadales bacterium]|nr:hypothetical protein [Gemmatimonadales bacterium]
MGFRKFTDRDKQSWEIRPVTRSEWEFAPAGDNPNRPKTVPSPGYEKDPYELSQEELQRLFDGSTAAPVRNLKNPFKE